MKYLWGVYFALVLAFLASADASKTLQSPDTHALLAYKFQQQVGRKEAYYYRFLSYYNYENPEKRVKSMRFWGNNLHMQRGLVFAKPVPGSQGKLFAIDLREIGWHPDDFSKVARREPYFREPAIESATAIMLRKRIGIDQDPKTLHVEVIVRADWFFRETMESDRSPSYYELLYSKLRKRPKNEADFEKIFAVDKFREHLKEFKIDTRHGAVVEGMENGVSIVARQNRLVERIITSMGSYYKTFDVKETTGRRDFAETLNKDFEFDAGEILADLPAGGMAALLVDAKGNIVEVADNRFASDSSDHKFDSRVRTPGSCFICHEMKYIKPKNLVAEMLRAGVDIKFKNKEDAVDARGFFLDWEDKLEDEQTRFTRFIARTSGFKPGENAANLKAWRDEYDAPVNLATAIRETGIPENVFRLIVSRGTKARTAMLLRGMSIPRRTWEVDTYKEVQLLLDAYRK